MGAWRNSTEIKQSNHAPRSGPEINNGSSAEDGAPERLGCGTIQEEASQIIRGCPQALYEEFSVLFCIGKRTREGCVRGSEVGTVHSG